MTLSVTADRIVDRLHDAWFGLRAHGLVPIETLVSDWDGCHDYFPTSFRAFRWFMREIDLRAGRDVFVDLGSGMGRALVAAARLPFKSVIGVEISERLNRIARANVERCRDRLACRDIQLWTGDATCYPIPDNATVFYFYNPFHGTALYSVFRAIEASARIAPRHIRIAFNNTSHFVKIEHKFPWLEVTARISLEHDCAVYRNRR